MNTTASLIAGLVVFQLLLPSSTYAQVYGGGNYGSDVYNGSAPTPTPTGFTPTPTPIASTPTPTPLPIATINTPLGSLPITGATVTTAASSGAILLALGLALRTYKRRHLG
jgi:hypothetical protein